MNDGNSMIVKRISWKESTTKFYDYDSIVILNVLTELFIITCKTGHAGDTMSIIGYHTK